MTNIRFLSDQILTVFDSNLEDSDIFAEIFYKDEVIETSIIDQDQDKNYLSLERDGCIIPYIPLSEIEILHV